MMDFRHFDAFRAVMRSENTVQAARLIGASQPAVSRLVAELERLSGLKLFDRSRGKLDPTAEAHALFQEIERRYAGLNAIREFTRSLRDRTLSPVRFGTGMSFGIGFSARAIATFRAEHPEVPVSHTMASSSLIADQVTARTCDIGLVTDNADVTSVSSAEFAVMDLLCAVPMGHPLERRAVITGPMLKGEPIVCYPREDMIRWGLANVLEEEGIDQAQTTLETPYSATVCALVREGGGIGFVHPVAAYDFLGNGIALRRFDRRLPVRTLLVKAIGSPLSSGAEQLGEVLARTLKSVEETVRGALVP